MLDVLRGTAILGTLASNIWIFAAPGGEMGVISGSGQLVDVGALMADPSPGAAAEALMRAGSNGKFLSLLTLLFGAGLAVQFRSAARRGLRWPGRYTWRALFLFAEGTLHFTLVFAWDVLMGYAVTALVAAWLLTRSRRARSAVMWVMGGLHIAVMGLVTFALAALSPSGGAGAEPAASAVRLYAEGGYLEQVTARLENAAVLRIEPVLTFALMMFLFLAGVRLLRAGAFDPGPAGAALRTRLMVWGLGAGLPINAATALAGDAFFFLDRYVAAPVVAVGLVGLVGRLLDSSAGHDRPGPIARAVACLGRTALSGYVLQNVLAMLLCYGFGLGLASRLAGSGPWWVIGAWAGIGLFLVAGSVLWLRRFEHGPLEAVQKAVLARVPERERTRRTDVTR
ncbi:membrane protein [Streptomonospora alba]|uniref:Membrane protein n=1 Tax=Streptomonospora alba TaxID=183763 RepID=A0A0C2JIJ5_9ACTN|nr:membrane protein [Streptomonospora alba]